MNHLGTVTLETQRLILRRFKENDAEEFFLGFVNQPEFLYYANNVEFNYAIISKINFNKYLLGGFYG